MISNDWLVPLSAEFKKPYYRKLYETVKSEYQSGVVYPPADKLLSAFELTPLEKVKVVILGQDPYHEPGQAHGLSFSVMPGTAVPPSLVNIYKELKEEMGLRIPNNGCLIPWAQQGVLLLNTILTVRAHQAFSLKGIGWEEFTDAAIRAVNEVDRPVVYLLFGRAAGEKSAMLNNPLHLVIKTAHPSPLSAYNGFFHSGCFRRCNDFLSANGETPINWQIPDL